MPLPSDLNTDTLEKQMELPENPYLSNPLLQELAISLKTKIRQAFPAGVSMGRLIDYGYTLRQKGFTAKDVRELLQLYSHMQEQFRTATQHVRNPSHNLKYGTFVRMESKDHSFDGYVIGGVVTRAGGEIMLVVENDEGELRLYAPMELRIVINEEASMTEA